METSLINISLKTESKTKKPAWCQSESAHKISEEMAEVNEEADLLDFVVNLDFDRYNEDLELQTLINQVNARIKMLQREKKKDETRLKSVLDVRHVLLDTVLLVTVGKPKFTASLLLMLQSERKHRT